MVFGFLIFLIYFKYLFQYFIHIFHFWFLKQTAILFYFTNTNFVFCVHLSLLSLPLSLFITYVCTLVSQFSFNTHFPADFGAFPSFTLPAKSSATSIHSVCGKYMSVCPSVCLSVCLFVCVCVYVHTYIYILTRISIYIHTYVTYSISIWIWIWIYIACPVTLASLIGQRP